MDLSYEETRKQRMEENKKRMEELGLMQLSGSMAKPKIKREIKKKPTLEEQGLERRRSTRVAANQAKEELLRAQEESEHEASDRSAASGSESDSEAGAPLVRTRTRYSLRRNRKSPPREEIIDGRQEAIEAAEFVQKELENPSFVVSLEEVHILTDFLDIPESFRKANLPPTSEDKVTLQDEEQNEEHKDGESKEWEVYLLAENGVLGNGWAKFVQDKKLGQGDACVFELLSSNKLKVHLLRAADYAEDEPPKRSSKKVKRETKVTNQDQVIDLEDTSEVENNEDDGSGDQWNPDGSSSEEEADQDDGDDNWRP